MRKITIRFEDDVANELDYLSAAYKVSKNEVINALVRAEYNKFESDPKFKVAIEQFHKIKETFEQVNSELNAAGFK